MSRMEENMTQPIRLDYCQYLLSSSLNYTLTHFADHSQQFSPDIINRYLAGERIPARLVWEQVKPHKRNSTKQMCRSTSPTSDSLMRR